MVLDVVETLSELVRIPSVNPMGRSVSGPEFLEARVTEHLEGLFTRLGLPSERHTVAPGRDNIITRLDGRVPPEQGGPLVLLEVHQDTVPIDGMKIDPFSGEVRDGRVYGRGACDIKGGMAAMLAALSRLVQERPPEMPTIALACSVNEEYGFTGAQQLQRIWSEGKSQLVPRLPDLAIVAEPTLLNVVVAHKGVARWRCHTHGRAAHSSDPSQGVNAIYRMGKVLAALERYAQEVPPTHQAHPLVGRPTLSVGTITGGISVNTVPDRCTIEIDRRVLPGEDPRHAWQEVIDFVSAHSGLAEPPTHDEPHMIAGGLPDHINGALAARLAEVVRTLGNPCELIGVPYGTDAAAFARTTMPVVVFGPGSIAQAHTEDEWVEVDQLRRAAEVYYEFCRVD